MSWDLAVRLVLSGAVAYLLGGIPWALVIGKTFYGVDVRNEGSGNLGATNVKRVLGWKAAIATLALDVGKGAIAVIVALLAVPAAQYGEAAQQWAMIVATFAAIAGHAYSPYIRLSGGKGIAVAAGALLILTPVVWPILLLTWLLVIALTRTVSLASVIVAIEFPILCAVFYPGDWPTIAFAVLAASLVLWRHHSNISRILKGTEPKMSLRRESSVPKEGGS